MDNLDELTNRELEVLALVSKGRRNWEIAQELCISEATVENHLHNIFGKLGVSSRTAAAIYALQSGLVKPVKIEEILHDG